MNGEKKEIGEDLYMCIWSKDIDFCDNEKLIMPEEGKHHRQQ